jgi:RNA polymerase sigma-70 factor, ECF subfamily
VSNPLHTGCGLNTTSDSLLARLGRPGEVEAWERFVHLYSPLLSALARRVGLAGPDEDDFVQDAFTRLLTGIPGYTADSQHRFRDWLKTVALNVWRDRCRKRFPAVGVIGLEPAVEEEFDFVEREQADALARRALQIMQTDFEQTSWQACWKTVVDGQAAEDVARELGMTRAAVYIARSRVLRRVREELNGLLD